YTRTRDLMREFATTLSAADEVVLTDIYSAGEPQIAGITIDALADAVRGASRKPVHVVKALDDVPRAVARLARPNDLVITLGAGSIGALPDRILAALREEPSSVRSGKKLEAGGEADPSAEASGESG
ncbi:MAG: hypothetical protein DMF85_17070, partial [Acidobacteria bacterium]